MTIIGSILGGAPSIAFAIYCPDLSEILPKSVINYFQFAVLLFVLAFAFGGFWLADKLYRQLFLLRSDVEIN